MKNVFVAALLLVVSTAAVGAGGRYYNETVKSWTITDGWSSTNKSIFLACSMITHYVAQNASERRQLRSDMVTYGISIGRNANMIMTWGSNDWHLTNGRKYEVRLHFAGYKSTWTVTTTAATDDGFAMLSTGVAKLEPEMVTQFMQAHSVTVWVNKKKLAKFNLDGSYAGFRKVVDCVKRGRQIASGGDTFGSDDTFGTMPNAANASSDTF